MGWVAPPSRHGIFPEGAEADDRPSVQIGDPFTEKLVIEAILEMAADRKSSRLAGTLALQGFPVHQARCAVPLGGMIHADRVHQRGTGMKR